MLIFALATSGLSAGMVAAPVTSVSDSWHAVACDPLANPSDSLHGVAFARVSNRVGIFGGDSLGEMPCVKVENRKS